ncbi:MAG: hypothetical protein Q8R79_06750 [Legionellaceae bacterium]|nr:hypothetical protein [Legionellaceae bacterium]
MLPDNFDVELELLLTTDAATWEWYSRFKKILDLISSEDAIKFFEKKQPFLESNENGNILILQAYIYVGQGEYKKAIEACEAAIQKNNPVAIGRRGLMYLRGEGEPDKVPNHQQASALFKEATEKGDVWAPCHLARMYRDGLLGEAPNVNKAMDYFTIAIQRGNSEAMVEFARLHFENAELGTSANFAIAAEFLEKGIEADYPEAMVERAWMFLYGEGEVDGKPNYTAAQKLFEKASDMGHIRAPGILGDMYYRAQIGSDTKGLANRAKAMEYFALGAHRGDPRAMHEYARAFLLKKDYVAAQTWFENASNSGFSLSSYELAHLYSLEDIGGAPNKQAELYYNALAASQGHQPAMHNLIDLTLATGPGLMPPSLTTASSATPDDKPVVPSTQIEVLNQQQASYLKTRVHTRIDELELEKQRFIPNNKERKTLKIEGLHKLEALLEKPNVSIQEVRNLLKDLQDKTKNAPVTAGFFSKKTATLLKEVEAALPPAPTV